MPCWKQFLKLWWKAAKKCCFKNACAQSQQVFYLLNFVLFFKCFWRNKHVGIDVISHAMAIKKTDHLKDDKHKHCEWNGDREWNCCREHSENEIENYCTKRQNKGIWKNCKKFAKRCLKILAKPCKNFATKHRNCRHPARKNCLPNSPKHHKQSEQNHCKHNWCKCGLN